MYYKLCSFMDQVARQDAKGQQKKQCWTNS